jgi:hypothetical protein
MQQDASFGWGVRFHCPFHCRWCNSGKKDFFAWNEPLRGLVTVLVSAPIKIDFLHVHTT